jgi:hypothetical protein
MKATVALKVLALTFVLAVAAKPCAASGNNWKEEVLLHDGRKLIVKRSQTYGGRSEPGQPAPIAEHTISFKLPGSEQTITWKSEYGSELGRTNFNLLAVHVLGGTPYVVASPNLCLSYNKWGRPNPPYVAFKYGRGHWDRIAFDALPTEFKTINVVLGIHKSQADELTSMGLVSSERISELNRHLEGPEFQTILRRPLTRDICPRYSSGPKAPNPIAPSAK